MKKQEIQKIKDKVSTLLGQRMVNMERWDNYAEFGFIPANRDVEIIRDQLRTTERIEEDFVVAAFCTFRWTYQDRIILANQDMFQPSIPILEANGLGIRDGEDVPDFDYLEYGSNRFDEINEQTFRPVYEQTLGFIVKKINVSKFGDLTIDFENGYRLEVFINVSDPNNCWQFYEIGVPHNITVGGNAIVEEDVDVTLT